MKRALHVILGLLIIWAFSSTSAEAESSSNYDHLLSAAKKYIGVPYQFGGTSASGFDCSGYTGHVMKEIGVSIPRTTGAQYSTGTPIGRDGLRIGDLVFFETYKKGPSHVGIYIGEDQFIHSSTSKGVIISSLNDPYYYAPRYLGAKRVLSYDLPVGRYHDIAKDFWAADSIAELSKDTLFLGYEKSYFKPDEEMTRAQAASLLAQQLDLNISSRKKVFADVKTDHWASGAILAAQKKNLLKSTGKEFNPEEAITRGDAAIALAEAFNLKSKGKAAEFSDVNSKHPAYSAVTALAANGISGGYNDGTFRPNEKVNRAQFAVLLDRSIEEK
ncbi:hydrolase Nlp/P60 [Bacillus infantis]|uniref:C40 family peptidase n=1 Tax=Bacillus infantis TaxID=324767 RepID=UPI00101E04DE|nr:C40 family peptidase [Bacillus infantis]RYI28844.1 hydrolase Nlp/P60 [Bacillus infantis]